MDSKIILSFISNHLKSVERQLSRFRIDKKMERLHRLRVDIKKVSALFAFIEKIYQEKFETDSLKLLFKKAGEIREYQITIELLDHLQPPPKSTTLQLKKQQRILLQQFINDINLYLQFVRKFRKNKYPDFKIPDKKIVRKYICTRRKKAAINFNSHDRSNMHRFRKLIKRIMYVYAVLPNKIKKDIELNFELINNVQLEVGNWHDTYSAIEFLSLHITEQKDKSFTELNQKEASQFESIFIHYPGLKI